ncbi:MAG: hypothetical protein IKF72_03600 [Kiritimatiellae bacterium]|nr:hypothetical protein [Kiritimatiellia bacterium]
MRDTIHHMGRRCRNWDYAGRGCYLITMTLRDRSKSILGRVRRSVGGEAQGSAAQGDMAHHSHIDARGQGEAVRGQGLFADGFVDTILFNEEALSRALAYMADNPRRLLEKREHAEYFHVVRKLIVRSPINGRALHFAAIGNQHLLAAPSLMQVQCSRHDFAYSKNSDSRIDARTKPITCTPSFEEKAADLLAAASHGAVLVSPCISHGEKEIARRAMSVGARLVVLLNKGFAPRYKPPGLYFDRCVEGRLLMLAPAAWPFLLGKKAMTRQDACVLNRIAQLLCGAGGAEIDYKGLVPADLERLVESATKQP